MNRNGRLIVVVTAIALSGCQSMPFSPPATSQVARGVLVAKAPQLAADQTMQRVTRGLLVSNAETETETPPAATREIQPASFQDAPAAPATAAGIEADYFAPQSTLVTPLPSQGPATLAELESIALATSPAVAVVAAELRALEGKRIQAGLTPNPVAGLTAEDINEDGGAGRYGVSFSKEIVRGNKNGVAQAVVDAEMETMRQRLAAVQHQLLTDVRQRYYQLLIAQEKVTVATDLVEASSQAVEMSNRLMEAGEAARTAVLQSEIERENALLLKRQAENEVQVARRRLNSLTGSAQPVYSVSGNVRETGELEEFEQELQALLAQSPELAAAIAGVEVARREVHRACVEAVPNLTWGTNLAYDLTGDDVIAGFQLQMPIPTIDRNQGRVLEAREQLEAARLDADKKSLELQMRLADAYGQWQDARLQVDAWNRIVLPKAQETLELVMRGYSEGEVDYLEWLTAQRTWSQTSLNYLENLGRMWTKYVEIRGLLLTDSLQ